MKKIDEKGRWKFNAMIINTKNIFRVAYGLATTALLLNCLAGCKKYANPAGVYENYNQTKTADSSVSRRILIVSIDGAVGVEVKKLVQSNSLPNISALIQHSKYTYNGLADPNTNDATTWATMATGVRPNKHGIFDDSFLPSLDVNNPHKALAFYPTMFYWLLQSRPTFKTVSISTWLQLNESLLAHATKRITPNTDAIVKDSTVRVLTNDDARVVLSDFSIVNQAGKAGAFSADNAGYASAVKTVDGYIGEIMNALKARKSFSKEDWLVVITSDHGGVQNTYGGPSAIERNIFSLFYHPKYSPLELNGTLFNTVNFNANVKVSLPDPNGLYGIGDGSITVEGKMKINAGSDGTYNAGSGYYKLIGKSKWGIYRQRTALSLRFTDDGGVATQIDPSNTFIDGNWHTFDCVIGTTFSNGIRSHTAKVYVDGALVSNSTNLSQVSTITDATPLLIGGASGVDFNLKDIRIWNKVLTDVEIANNACSQAAKPTDLEYSSLIGLWPGEDNGPVFKSALTGKPDIPLTGPYQYTVSANSLPCDLGASNFTVENISIAREVFFWLNVPLQSSWGLDGREFLTKFDTELLK